MKCSDKTFTFSDVKVIGKKIKDVMQVGFKLKYLRASEKAINQLKRMIMPWQWEFLYMVSPNLVLFLGF